MKYLSEGQFLIAAFFIPLLFSCTKDNVEEFYGNACDTTNVTYSETVRPVLDNNCMSCHFSGNSTGVDLEFYEDVKKVADDGRLLGSIKHLPGYKAMPLNGKLDECTINKIENWVTSGTPNN